MADPRGTWALNLGGTLNLLEAVKASGLQAPGRPGRLGGLLRQPRPRAPAGRRVCPLRPNNPYAASKAAADLLGIQHHLAHGTDVVMVRPFNHAGPRQSPRYVLAALARQVAEVEAGRKAGVEVGNLDVVRDFTDVRDVVRAYRLLAERGQPGEIYNLGSGRGLSSPTPWTCSGRWPRAPVEVRVDPARVRPVDQPLPGRRRLQAPRRHRLGARDSRSSRPWPICSRYGGPRPWPAVPEGPRKDILVVGEVTPGGGASVVSSRPGGPWPCGRGIPGPGACVPARRRNIPGTRGGRAGRCCSS